MSTLIGAGINVKTKSPNDHATKIIRQDLTKELPIIALTGAAMKEDRERSLGAEMNDFLTKPVDLAQLKEKIVRWAGSPGPLTKNPVSS